MPDVSFYDQYISLTAGRVFVREWLPATVPARVPLLLLHDSLGCTELWRDFPAELCARTGRRVISYDRPGFGRSDARKDEMPVTLIRDETEVIAELVSELRLDEFILFGHSIGGGMALTTASYLTSCRAVISEAAQTFMEDRIRQGVRAAADGFRHDENRLQKLRRYHGDKAEWVLRSWVDTWSSAAMNDWHLKAELAALEVPVLALHGRRDEFGSDAQAELIQATVPAPVELYLLDCAHIPHREIPAQVLDLTKKFLNGLRN